jgi:ATP-dependent helicase/nuclease subunit A
MSVLLSDRDITFPHYIILKASAGAGKTRALTNRYVQFLLSEKIQNNKLKNILAITFSNNATRQMKERILKILKNLYEKDQETIKEFSTLLNIDEDKLSLKAKETIEKILNNYSDFQVKTIDSFMATLFKASSTDFGYTPDFEIIMNNNEVLTYAFELFMRDAKEGSIVLNNLIETVERISMSKSGNSAYMWDASKEILMTFKNLYGKESSTLKIFTFDDSLLQRKKEIEDKLRNIMKEIIYRVNNSSLQRNRSCKILDKFPEILDKGDFHVLVDCGLDRCPVNIPKGKGQAEISQYEYIYGLWKEFQKIVEEYTELYSNIYYLPYYGIYSDFKEKLQRVKLREGKVFIEDITRLIASFLSNMVPDIYFRLSERIYHFLIDEFQDTSQLQWHNLYPLIENSLSVKGSLFVVGDTKQAIYTFRNADYRIMKELESTNLFPGAKKIVSELDINYRSGGRIVEFVEEVFKKRLPVNEKYRDATKSGLTDFKQVPRDEKKNKGYVELKAFNPSDDGNNNREDETKEEKIYLLDVINDLKKRGYSYSDMAVLSYKNNSIIMLSQWLNENNIEILSYSSLDVRKRKVSDELLHLLRFLDSPLDDFSFSVFLKGNIYLNYLKFLQPSASGGEVRVSLQPDTVRQCHSATVLQCVFGQSDIDQFLIKYRDSEEPLYKTFREEYPQIWQRDFEELFRLTGYLPLYDLLSMAMSKFRVFEAMPEEEATFIKFLELAIYFEGKGMSSIKDFIEFFSGHGEDEKVWNISMPSEVDAVRLMTVHKAKGLEFPAVIFYMYESRPDSKLYYMKEDGETFSVIKINKEMTKNSGTLKNFQDKISLESKIDKLNTLYVALTRAEEELYVFTSLNKKNEAPVELLFSEERTTFGDKLAPEEVARLKAREKETPPQILPITHSFMKGEFPVEEGEIHIEEKQRGELIHKVLSWIEYLESEGLSEKIKERIDRLNQETVWKVSYEEIEAILKALQKTPLKKYFIPLAGRIIRNEIEFTSPAGELFRMDRLVIDRDTVTVIDYKTGHPAEEEYLRHEEQVRHYKKLLRDVYREKSVKGFLYYIDMDKVVEV